jgi:hypothetical protein
MELGLISLSDLTADPHTGRPVSALDRSTRRWPTRAADELGSTSSPSASTTATSSPSPHQPSSSQQSQAKTERIRLASGVTVLSALDPVRVYQFVPAALREEPRVPRTWRWRPPRIAGRGVQPRHARSRPWCV